MQCFVQCNQASFHCITKRTVFLPSRLRWRPFLVLRYFLRSSELSCTLTDGLSTNDITCTPVEISFSFFLYDIARRQILLGFEQKRLYPLMNRIIITFG